MTAPCSVGPCGIAMAGKSTATSTAWLEWAADPRSDPASDETRWSANPAWNTRINHEVVQGEFESYPPDRFALDRLGHLAPAACGLFYDHAMTAGLRHVGQPDLTAALAAARKSVEDGEGAWRWGWRRSAADITPLYAATVALWALMQSPDTEPSIFYL
jgi:hypothetical protein